MVIIRIEMDQWLYDAIEQSAQTEGLTVQQECLRRLRGEETRSRYVQALIAELRADEEQRRAARRMHAAKS
ncbi:hypothetical protein ASF84_02875 [Pseudomonas sp. Leaf127]|uniref:hypothetical protein n=1 Tax=Pseudomonas sp. Leaf127 TaxID=1736267 RepID=UPI00070279F6|nr:hypothetical protein [Pseudomonas sp. Leaf127]KQQ68094.1 hypothetical protein ASF84_02875 [Pseudomonas sp. Leaf127]